MTTTKEPTFEELLLAYERVLFRHGQWNNNNVEEYRKLVCEQSALKINILELHNSQIETLKAAGTRVEQALRAAHRMLSGYPYRACHRSGGPMDCQHNNAPRLHCRACDKALVEAVVGELGR